MRQLKKVGLMVVALILCLSAANFAFAEGSVKTVNMNEILTQDQQEMERSLAAFPFIPSGYTANTIFALSMTIEQVNNPRAYMILQRNIDLAIAKWIEEQKLKEQKQKHLASKKRKKAVVAKANKQAKPKTKSQDKTDKAAAAEHVDATKENVDETEVAAATGQQPEEASAEQAERKAQAEKEEKAEERAEKDAKKEAEKEEKKRKRIVIKTKNRKMKKTKMKVKIIPIRMSTMKMRMMKGTTIEHRAS